MNADRLALVAVRLAALDGPLSIEGLLELCVEMLDVTGASLAVIEDGQHLGSFATTGASAAAVDELQFTLGEGPCISADRGLTAVLQPDLSTAVGDWPAFAAAAADLGVAAAFAFPLRVGVVHLGVLTLYRSSVGDLDAVDLADAVTLARVATYLLLDLEGELPPGTLPLHLADIVDNRATVHQATGMVAAQLGADVRIALGRLRAYVWSRDLSLGDVADDVVARRLRFEHS